MGGCEGAGEEDKVEAKRGKKRVEVDISFNSLVPNDTIWCHELP